MRIKTYQTRSIPTALAQIKKDLGPGAVILNTKRHVNRRFFGLLPSVAYEVTAAVDQTLPQPAPEEVQEKSMATNTYEVADTPPRSDGKRERFTPDPVEVETLRSPTTRGRQEWGAMLHNLHADVEEIKRVVLWSESIASSAEADFKKMFLSLIPTPLQSNRELAQQLWLTFRRLLIQGVNRNIAIDILTEIVQQPLDDTAYEECHNIRLSRAICRRVPVVNWEAASSKNWIFFGPTGVGKTTTIAKLAAHIAIGKKRPLQLLTMDSYRIAAADQLRTYAELIGVPLRQVGSVEELHTILSTARPDLYTLIDTTGHSPREISKSDHLATFLREFKGIQRQLVLSVTTRQEDLQVASQAFSMFSPDALVFTKLDESSGFGPIINEVVRTKRPVTFLTNGQRVPDDLIMPSNTDYGSLLLRLK